jgi:hypothetical protein
MVSVRELSYPEGSRQMHIVWRDPGSVVGSWAMTDAAAAESSGGHEQVVELRKEAYTMALYVAICLPAAFAALPETGVHTHVIGLIWGVTVGLALAHWFAFRVSARMVGAGSVRPHDVKSAGAQLAGAAGVAVLASVPVVLFRSRSSWSSWNCCWPRSSRWLASPSPVVVVRRWHGRWSTRCWCLLWLWPSRW